MRHTLVTANEEHFGAVHYEKISLLGYCPHGNNVLSQQIKVFVLLNRSNVPSKEEYG